MKICRVTKYLPGNRAHPGVQHAYFLAKFIQEPTLIIAKKDAREGYALPGHVVVKEISYRDFAFSASLAPVDGGVKAMARRIRTAVAFVAKMQEALFLIKAVPALLAFRPDVVHSHGLMALSHGLVAKCLVGSRVVLTLHGGADAGVVARLAVVRGLLKYADRIVCVSKELRQQVADYVNADRLECIPSAVDLSMFRELHLPRKKQLVAVGYFKWQKGYRYMLDAMVDVVRRLDDCRLLIIGDGPERESIAMRIAELGLSGRVELTGALPQDQIVRHLNESRLFVMSSLIEGLPKALLEALACGTPLVVTRACNAAGFIDRVGIQVEPRDSQGLARAVIELLVDSARWERLAANCRSVAEEYGWEAVARRMVELYRRL